MDINSFNSHLQQICQHYQLSQTLKSFLLQQFNQDHIIECLQQNLFTIEQANQNCQGYISKERLLEKINKLNQNQFETVRNYLNKKYGLNAIRSLIKENKNNQGLGYSLEKLNELFPYSKIAFSTIVTTCLKNYNKNLDLRKNQQQSQNLSITKISQLKQKELNSIITNSILLIIKSQLQILSLRKSIIPMIQLYIPMQQKNLTQQELVDYLRCQKLALNPKCIIQALNNGGKQNKNYLEFEFYGEKKNKANEREKQNLEKQGNLSSFYMKKETVSKIEEIMERLNKRVDNFGKEWLINQQ